MPQYQFQSPYGVVTYQFSLRDISFAYVNFDSDSIDAVCNMFATPTNLETLQQSLAFAYGQEAQFQLGLTVSQADALSWAKYTTSVEHLNEDNPPADEASPYTACFLAQDFGPSKASIAM